MTSRLPSLHLRAGTLSDEELFHHWRNGIGPYFETVPLVDPRQPPVQPEVRQHHVGSFLFIETAASQQKYLRDPEWMRRNDDADHVVVQAYLKGRNRVENRRHHFLQEPGTISAVNLGYEVEAVSDAAEVLSLVIPREVLAERLPELLDASGPLFEPNATASRIVGDFMLSLRNTLPHATLEDAPMLVDGLFGLLGCVLAGGDAGAKDAWDGALLALKRYIDAHLRDPALDTARLCAEFKISRSTVYRLFRKEGGVQAYILRRRLMACFRVLSSPNSLHRRIYDIGLDFNLDNPSHMTALFRKNFGMSPSDVREAAHHRLAAGRVAMPAVGTPDVSDVERMRQWAEEIGVVPANGTEDPGGAGAHGTIGTA